MNSFSQNNTQNYTFWNADMQAIAKPESKEGWVKFKDNLATPIAQIMPTHKTAFGLGVDDSLHLVKNWTTNDGWEIFKYQQYYKGIKVEGGEAFTRTNGNKTKTNHLLAKGLSLNIAPSLNYISAVTIAQTDFIANLTAVELIVYQNTTNLLQNSSALVINQNQLAYSINVWHRELDLNKQYVINANNGSIKATYSNDILFSQNTYTHMYGIQTVECSDSSNSSYVYNATHPSLSYYDSATYMKYFFKDTTRGDGIECFIYKKYPSHKTYSNAFHRNNWVGGDQRRAASAFWSASVFFDYLQDVHGYFGVDDNGRKVNLVTSSVQSKLKASNSLPYSNSIVEIEIGPNDETMQIVGHEMGHAVVRYTCNFNNQNNSEAANLNEGFGDIIGYLCDQYGSSFYTVVGSGNINWLSNYLNPFDEPKRSMRFPKNYGYPDYYQGAIWDFNSNSYPHNNSTVFSHWFYLFAKGTNDLSRSTVNGSIQGEKQNEVGNIYRFEGVGIPLAEQLIFKVITQYASSNYSFEDMRAATIEALIDMGEECHLPILIKAWECVGVYGNGVDPNILSGTTSTNTIFDDSLSIYDLIIDNNAQVTLQNNNFHIYSNSNITVKPSATLILENANFYFGKNAGIIVENGGNLILDEDTLTYWQGSLDCISILDTNSTWNGIYFEGSPTSLINITNSTISNTKEGIYINAPIFNFKNNNYINNLKPLNIKYITSIDTINTLKNNLFKNNDFNLFNHQTIYKFIEINEYTNIDIKNNHFMDSVNHAPTNAIYINTNNHSNELSITDNHFSLCELAISIEGDSKIDISNNTFYSNSNDKVLPWTDNYCGTGLTELLELHYFKESKAIVNKNNLKTITTDANKFTNYNRAIYSENSFSIDVENDTFINSFNDIIFIDMYSTSIKNNIFTNDNIEHTAIQVLGANSGFPSFIENNSFTGYGKTLDIRASSYLKIIDNDINNIKFSNTQPNKGYGIFIQACSDFEIKDNNIKDEVAYYPPITLSTGYNGSTTSNTSNSGSDNSSTISPLSFGAKAIIIENATIGNNRILRNNIENVNIGIQTQYQNNNLRMKCNTIDANYYGLLVFDELENQGKDCNLHSGLQHLPGNVFSEPCDPTNTFQHAGRDIRLAPTALNYNFKYYAHEYGAGGERTAPDSNNLDQFAGNYIVCDGNNGNLEQIMAIDFCDDINLYTGWKKELIDEEIQVIKIPQEILDLLTKKMNFANQMVQVEAQITDRETQRDLVDKLNSYQSEVSNINKIIVSLYEKNGDELAAKLLLEQENSIEAKMLLVQKYIENGETLDAQRVINEVLQMNKIDEAFFDDEKQTKYADNKDYEAEILEIEKILKESGRAKSELSEIEKTNLRLIRDVSLPISTKAECLLALNGDAVLEHPIKVLSTEYLNQLNTNMVFNYMLNLNPNPASNNVTINYDLPIDAANYSLQIIDDYQNIGKVMTTKTITNTSTITVNVNSYTSGVYTVVIYRNDLSVATAQLIVVH